MHTLGVGKDAPAVFRLAVARGEWVGHLFDRDEDRLRRTAAALGVKVVYVDRRGEAAQHIDLCGWPLQRALLLCENADAIPARPGLPATVAATPPELVNAQPDFSEFGIPPELIGERTGGNYAAAYEADRAAQPNQPPRPPVRPAEEMRFGNMGPMGRPTYKGTGADE